MSGSGSESAATSVSTPLPSKQPRLSSATSNQPSRSPPATANSPAHLGGPLLAKLASVLPQGCIFGVYHLSTPPTRTEPLCAPPPGGRPDKTFLEQHFLAVSVPLPAHVRTGSHGLVAAAKKRSSPGAGDLKHSATHGSAEDPSVLVLALEVFVFTTAYLTTIFVSKADTTGCLHLLSLPRGTPSPVRQISCAFVDLLLEHRRRQGIPAVVNLFARAQAQYLFPLSVENTGKHVQDDRGLVRWWCRVLDSLLVRHGGGKPEQKGGCVETRGYLMVPGLEDMEIGALLPRTPSTSGKWVIGHPLERISHYAAELVQVPPRCLIPRYPDDPKSRFYDELDEEAAMRKQDTGIWKSVKTLDQFWDMMAFRQECSSGRLTGFLWLVLDPKKDHDLSLAQTSRRSPGKSTTPALPTPSGSFNAGVPNSMPDSLHRLVDLSVPTPQPSPIKQLPVSLFADSTPNRVGHGHNEIPGKKKRKAKRKTKQLIGPIKPRQPRMKMEQRNYLADRPAATAYYFWPPAGRGEKLVEEHDYKRIVELLLHLEFSTLDKAIDSTRRWTSEVAVGSKWGQKVTGTQPSPSSETQANQSKAHESTNPSFQKEDGSAEERRIGGPANVLAAGLLRKKRKEAVGDATGQSGGPREQEGSPKINVLGAGLVRKRPKIM